MTERTVSCKTCRFGDWTTSGKTCGKCIGFHKWLPKLEKPKKKQEV